jgi:hypothetical protein
MVFCFLGGLALTFYFSTLHGTFMPTSWQSAASRLIAEVGDALMIAPILAIIIEITAAKEMLTGFAEDVSLHIIGRCLPRSLREHILRFLTIDFIRKRWEVAYSLDDSSCRTGFVRLISLSSSAIENVSSASASFDCQCEIETRHECALALPILRRAKATTGEKVCFEKAFRDPSDLGKSVDTTPSGLYQRFTNKIDVAPGATVQHEFEIIECFPDYFEAHFVSLLPVLEVVVRVLYPIDRFKVDLYLSYADHEHALKTELTNGVYSGESLCRCYRGRAFPSHGSVLWQEEQPICVPRKLATWRKYQRVVKQLGS